MWEMFRDHQGNISSMRVTWTITVLTLVFVWAYVSVTTKHLQAFTMGDAAWFGALFAGKVGQSYVERMNNGNSQNSKNRQQNTTS